MNNFLDKIKELLTNDKLSKVKAFFIKYKNYICVCGLFVVMLIVLVLFTGEEAIAERLEKLNNRTVSGEDYVPDKEFEVDAYPELNALITNYFHAYVNADFETLETLATPISEMEKSYISIMSQYYESYDNIKCYTKHGLSQNSYIVSVRFDIKFHDQEVVAPSMVLFYVQTNVDGKLYINNLYSDFNMKYAEVNVNKDIYTALRKYITQEDYLELHSDVEASFNTLIKENSDIYQLVKRTIPAVRQEWEDAVYYAPEIPTEDTEVTQGTEDTENSQTTETTTTEEPTTETTTTEEPATETTTTETPEESESEEPESTVVKVKALNAVNIRSSMNTDGTDNVIRTSEVGEVFVKLGEEGDWTKVQLEGDTYGYMKTSFLEVVTE